MARRVKSLHHNLQEGQNVVFHREHRSKKNRRFKNGSLIPYKRKLEELKIKDLEDNLET